MRQGNKGDFFRSFYFIFLLFHFLKEISQRPPPPPPLRSTSKKQTAAAATTRFFFFSFFFCFYFPFFCFFSPSFPRFLGRRVLFLRPPSNRILPSFFLVVLVFHNYASPLLKKGFSMWIGSTLFPPKKKSAVFFLKPI